MWQDLDGLGGPGVNSGAHVDQFGSTGKKKQLKILKKLHQLASLASMHSTPVNSCIP